LYGGNSVKKKYALVVWPVVWKSKSQGSLDVLNSEFMNQCLLAKWLVRYLDAIVVGL
jgi:hypothetical protein